MKTLKKSMTNKGKKGFTLTELAIVIAVIAILIAVLVPTFSSVISKAKASNESVACANEWQNFYIDADIAANGTDDNYLVVYTDNKYTENDTTYYHGYLATAGVYDSTTQLDVTISAYNIITYNNDKYNYVGSYEYMAKEVSIFSTGSTVSLVESATFEDSSSSSYTVNITNSGIKITGYGTDYYITGKYTGDDDSAVSSLFKGSYNEQITSIFAIRVYFEGDVTINKIKSDNEEKTDDIKLDGDYYLNLVLSGNTSTKYEITYTPKGSSDSSSNGSSKTITIHNNTSPTSDDSSSSSSPASS